MIANGLSGFNTRVLGGISRDNIIGAQHKVSGAVMLAMDDPQLALDARNAGAISIYRQTGDAPEDDPLRFTSAAFMSERLKNAASANYVHSYNELDPSPLLVKRTIEGMKLAEAVGQKAMILNLATNKTRAQWEMCLPAIQYAAEHGHGVGVHFYPDNIHDAGGLEWRDIKHAVGGFWCFTEFGYLRDITKSATLGWRGTTLDKPAFVRKWTPLFEEENMPACWFGYDFWDQPTVAIAKSDGLGYNDLPDVLNEMETLNKTYVFKGVKPVPTPPTVHVPSPLGAPLLATVTHTDGLNLRADAGISYAKVGAIPFNGLVTTYPNTDTLNKADGYLWRYVDYGAGSPGSVQGWGAVSVGGQASFAPVEAPPTPDVWTVKLDVPFVSQTNQDADRSPNDCGIASLLMLTRFWHATHGLLVPRIPTVDDCFPYTPLANKPPPKGLTFAEVGALATGLGFKYSYGGGYTTDHIMQNLLVGIPMFLLLNYAVFNPPDSFDGAHFAVVKGYNDTDFLFNDPYHGGADFKISRARLDAALQNVPGNTGAYQGFQLS